MKNMLMALTLSALASSTLANSAFAQVSPELSAWIQNTSGVTGYGNIETNVQKVQYSDRYVYVSCTCIPGYDIGPWPGNPNTPKNQNFLFQIPRIPVENTGSLTATPLGHIGVWSNGVSIFNAKDARSYNNQDIWHQNAVVVEGSSFDECLGHPAPNGEYHHHLNPVCLYDSKDGSKHSPIIGYAFDGYPIYGAYGFANPDGTGGITRMRSSYVLRDITTRTTLANGSSVAAGPPVSQQYPLGYYIEDFEYNKGSGDLDENNGRFCVTPEYPHGTYAYFVTIDTNGNAAYPYTLGPNYHGVVQMSDIGPASGHVNITESVLSYTSTAGAVGFATHASDLSLYPSPATQYVTLDYSSTEDYATAYSVVDSRGSIVASGSMRGPTVMLDLASLPAGQYHARVTTSSGMSVISRFVRQ